MDPHAAPNAHPSNPATSGPSHGSPHDAGGAAHPEAHGGSGHGGHQGGGHPYRRFLLTIAASTALMYGLMYLNTYQLSHVRWSQTRFWMALVMGAGMAVVMWAFMRHMYTDRRKNLALLVGSAALFALSLWMVRSQATVGDVSWMKAMIPHHSIAILTSERARLADPRVRQLAGEIVETQRREIAEMEALIDSLQAAR